MMKRQEQIVQAAAHERSVSEERAFMRGAQWADTHPDNGLGFEPKSLEECIEDATPTWKAVDVDAFLDELRGREPAGWISVEDALPPIDEKSFNPDWSISVLVAEEDDDTIGIDFYDYGHNEWVNSIDPITHWMPLPQPPSCSEFPNYKKGGN